MTIEERLENMEREVGCVKRRNRWMLGAILVFLAGLVAAGVFKTTMTTAQVEVAGTAKEIRTRGIYIEDEKGDTRAVLYVNENGPFLRLSGEDGFTRAVLGVFKDGPFLWLSDENGKHRVLLNISKGSPGLSLNDEKGNARFAAGKTKTVSSDGKIIEYPESSLILYGPDGKVIWSAIE